jgi:hypothetical protein
MLFRQIPLILITGDLVHESRGIFIATPLLSLILSQTPLVSISTFYFKVFIIFHFVNAKLG